MRELDAKLITQDQKNGPSFPPISTPLVATTELELGQITKSPKATQEKMSRSSENYYSGRRPGWDTTSDDYHSHLTRMVRMPSVIPDMPRYPNFHARFNKSSEETESVYEPKPPETQNPGRKKVQFSSGEGGVNGSRETQEGVDSEASGYLQQRRKNFELCKWSTFKVTG
ncbi:hypothetical protein NMG60_11002937 [Bertholletia excelsa]